MKRDIVKLGEQSFDVLIVGGGIHGAAAVRQCAEQGMKAALIEKADFGGATSANSLKIIHGGFRYLQHLNIKRMRESIVSRRLMSQLSPENIRALRCAIPNSGWGLRSKMLMRLALLLNDVISFDRNRGVRQECRIPAGEILSLEECRKQFPLIDWTGKTGGAIWHDAIALNSERLTLAFVQQAVQLGATVANYLELKEILVEAGKAVGVRAYDSVSGNDLLIKAEALIISAGSNNDRLLGRHQNKRDMQKKWAKAVNVVVKRKLLDDTAIGLTGEADFTDKDAVIKKNGRFFFFVPWRGYTMIGTTYSFDKNTSAVKADRGDIEDILREVNDIFPGAALTLDEVGNVHAGLVPAYSHASRKDEVQLVKETEVADLTKKVVNPIQGIFTIKSVKYTTAPLVAFSTAKKVAAYLGFPLPKKIQFSLNPSGAEENKAENSHAHGRLLQDRYGSLSGKVGKYIAADNDLLCADTPLYGGEVKYFIKEEMARTLSDIVFRRSPVASAECPSTKILTLIAERMALHLDWKEEKISREIKEVENAFDWRNSAPALGKRS
ncbi:glycerol-3-phosphate dehydrogenase/oxidase [Desulfopila inferna]|uniref:glycerol-3-phosphate dehydrogenase/oxidase n=1 Tax=Desulfopila inferna TaxID=468528 RepID=UPI00196511C5|nr:FAD-dependent oxidoreductase [Desulfopila inferna]MBM9602706.1 FAD-dependent oxidoreductase [Desulfopila inferna]